MNTRPTRVVDLFLTYDCNCRCPYCFVKDRGNALSMSPAVLDRAIDWVVETADGDVDIVFLGGEPTLEPELIERAVLRARRYESMCPVRFSFTMTTNFLRMDQELAQRLAEWGVSYLVSVDGTGKRHDRARPSTEYASPYDVIRRKLPQMLAHQPYMGARVTPLPKNVPWLCEDLHALNQLGFRHFIVSPATGIRWSDTALDGFVEQLSNFAASRDVNDRGMPVPVLEGIDDGDEYSGYWGCGAGHGRVSIDASGKIFACARFNNLDPDAGLVMGDIYSGIDAHGAVTLFEQAAHAPRPVCEDCHLRDRCLGGCPAVNLEETGNLVGPSLNECRFNKSMDRVRQHIIEVSTTWTREKSNGQETDKH